MDTIHTRTHTHMYTHARMHILYTHTHTVTCPSICSISSCHTDKSYDYDQSQVTTMTDISQTNASTNIPVHKKSASLSLEDCLGKNKGEGKLQHVSTSQKRTSGYVEIVTAKDGKRYIKDDPAAVDGSQAKLVTSGQSELTPSTDTSNLSRNNSYHSYQNVPGAALPHTALPHTAHVNGTLSGREVAKAPDFKLSAVADSIA